MCSQTEAVQLIPRSVENYPFFVINNRQPHSVFPNGVLFITIGTCFGMHAQYCLREISFTKYLSSLEITTRQDPLVDPIPNQIILIIKR